MRNRDYIHVAPLDSDVLMALALPHVPRTMEPVALITLDSMSRRPDAIMVRLKSSGALVSWRPNGAIASLDPRKASAAISWLEANPPQPEETKADLAATLREWRSRAGMTQARAAEVLGMSKRSYEGIEAGRGFVYPKLLMLALLAFDA